MLPIGRTCELQDIQLSIGRSVLCALLGRVGAGKTALVSATLGVIKFRGNTNDAFNRPCAATASDSLNTIKESITIGLPFEDL